MYLDNVYLGFTTMGKQFVTVADGAQQLADGSAKLTDGLGQAADGGDQLASGLGQAASGGKTLSDAGAPLASGASQLASGMNTMADADRADARPDQDDVGRRRLAGVRDDAVRRGRRPVRGRDQLDRRPAARRSRSSCPT